MAEKQNFGGFLRYQAEGIISGTYRKEENGELKYESINLDRMGGSEFIKLADPNQAKLVGEGMMVTVEGTIQEFRSGKSLSPARITSINGEVVKA